MAVYIAWQDRYSVGVKTLDDQHKQILDIINVLFDAVQERPDKEIVKTTLDRLVRYTMTHFRDEEELMQSHGYPDLARHKLLHETMRQKTLAMQEQANLTMDKDLLRFLKEWWVNHIQDCDKRYAQHMATEEVPT
jgi:hemerythrin